MVKNQPAKMGDVGSTSGLKRSPGGGNENPLSILFFFFFTQYSCLGNPTDRGSWKAIVHRVEKSQTRLCLTENLNFL